MENASKASPRFPKDLLEWAGHHSGGVKRLFDPGSGRPGKELLRTRLISRLEAWAQEAASGTPGAPRILLLVGGPGNGKTEAIEHTINCLDKVLAANGKLVESLSEAFHPPVGKAVARVVDVDAGNLASVPRQMRLSIVQDASATAGQEGRPAPELLVEELLGLLDSTSGRYYLCCVNRGVLDDALIHALDHGLGRARDLLEAVTRSVSLSSTAPSCWPLGDFPEVAVWPMDVESLLVSPSEGLPSPASTLLAYATNRTHWPGAGECPAGDDCPFCHSQRLLAREEPRLALLQILRWYETSKWQTLELSRSILPSLLSACRQPPCWPGAAGRPLPVGCLLDGTR